MKEHILSALRKNTETYVSGKALSEKLQCSRMAIWKHVEDLREQGYRIESMHRKGYRLISEVDVLDPNALSLQLESQTIGSEIVYYPVVPTTQTIAHQLARQGYAEGTCVIADRQMEGRGRLGRKWHAPAGVGLWMSIILRPQLPLEYISQMTLVTAVAVAKAISYFGYAPVIKWPNDILIDGKKVCGILTELQGDIDRVKYLILGIGINVDQREEELDPQITDRATSLYIANGERCPKRSQLFIEVCKQLENLYTIYLQYGFAPIQSLWEAYAMSTMQKVKVHAHQQTFLGTLQGITEKGSLLVMDDHGEMHEIVSADIELYTQ